MASRYNLEQVKRLISVCDYVKKIVRYNVSCLKLKNTPDVKIEDGTKFETRKIPVKLSEDGKCININVARVCDKSELNTATLWYATSHECHLLWQKENKDLANTKKYKEQFTDIEAHAWASVAIMDTFRLAPQLEKQFGKEMWDKVSRRAKEIWEA